MKLQTENDQVGCFNKNNGTEIKAAWLQKILLLVNLNNLFQKGK